MEENIGNSPKNSPRKFKLKNKWETELTEDRYPHHPPEQRRWEVGSGMLLLKIKPEKDFTVNDPNVKRLVRKKIMKFTKEMENMPKRNLDYC